MQTALEALLRSVRLLHMQNRMPLSSLHQEERMHLVARITRAFLEIPSWESAHLPFQYVDGKNDPVGEGVVNAHECVEQNSDGTQSEVATFTFSHAQLILACCFYGAVALPIHISHTFEALSASTFTLHLSAFASKHDDQCTLGFVLTRLDKEWHNEDEEKLLDSIFPPKAGACLETLLCLKTSCIGCEDAHPPFSDTYETNHKLNEKLLQDKRESYMGALIPPPSSLYADAMVLCGDILFLIHSNVCPDFARDMEQVREAILQMGLVLADMRQKEFDTYEAHLLLTSQLCQKMVIARVVPVFCVREKVSGSTITDFEAAMPSRRFTKVLQSRIHRRLKGEEEKPIDVSGYQVETLMKDQQNMKYVQPITFVPPVSLEGTFTRRVSNKIPNPNSWTYHEKPCQGREEVAI
ncbi:hypothetical protein STCU_12290 [Strigomonas culicis]|uniref:Uncharacterized protein n=1 Tax=Strigomonas culicis TaxID=28005 RepID=S9UXC0_9TRYP|nr:hypothetical protein STCU_12290 [Strigomonas culicis]|eukprot:EPY15170.1 hypothetical protein STCU_12290 [Strigomonas culicis]